MSHSKGRRATIWLLLLALAMTTALTACENSAHDELMEGRKALQEGQPDLAEEHLRAALEAEPQMLEAQRLLANVHMSRGDFEGAENTLTQIWRARGFEREEELSPDALSARQILQKQFGALYRQWAESIDFADSPDEFEAVVRKGLERNARDSQLQRLLIDFYQYRADRFIERNQKIEAAEMLENIDDLQAFTDERREARQRARNLRREAFGVEARKRFDDELSAALIESGVYEPETRTVVLEGTVERSLDQDTDLEQARHMTVQTLLPELGQLAASLADLDVEQLNLSVLKVPRLTVRDETREGSQFTMVVSLELSEVIDMAFEYSEAHRLEHEAPTPIDTTPSGGVTIDREAIELDTRAVD